MSKWIRQGIDVLRHRLCTANMAQWTEQELKDAHNVIDLLETHLGACELIPHRPADDERAEVEVDVGIWDRGMEQLRLASHALKLVQKMGTGTGVDLEWAANSKAREYVLAFAVELTQPIHAFLEGQKETTDDECAEVPTDAELRKRVKKEIARLDIVVDSMYTNAASTSSDEYLASNIALALENVLDPKHCALRSADLFGHDGDFDRLWAEAGLHDSRGDVADRRGQGEGVKDED